MIFRKSTLAIVIPVLTIGIFVIVLAFSLIRLSAIEKDMRLEATQNMLWVIARSQVGSLQLQKAAALRVEGRVDGLDVDRRLNNLLSHNNVLNHGPQRRQMDVMGPFQELDQLESEKVELRSIITELKTGDKEALSRIYAILAPYDLMLLRAANMAMIAEWDSLGDRLENSRTQISFIITSLVIIALAGTAMTLHLISASRSASARARLLEREKAFSQLLVASSSEGIIAADLDRNCTLWNEAAATLFGVSVDYSSSPTLADASSFFAVERIEKALGSAEQGRPIVLRDLPFFRSVDAAPIYLDLRCFPLRDGSRIIGSIILLSDITEQYEARRQLSERRDYLEEQVLLRTQELNAALARERAATDIYRNFAAMVSHQFRTPLSIVDSSLQRIIRRADHLVPAEIQQRGQHARSAILRLVRLVESTLDVARLDNGQIEQKSRPWNIYQSIQDAILQQSEETPERQFIFESAGDLIVHCDPVHTEHIIANLLSNAAKYALEGSVIHIETVRTERKAGCRVVNEGMINPNDRPHFFERYFRGGNAHQQNGVGIGLYMARSLARLQDGDVYVEEPKEGYVAFTFLLPLASSSWQSRSG